MPLCVLKWIMNNYGTSTSGPKIIEMGVLMPFFMQV